MLTKPNTIITRRAEATVQVFTDDDSVVLGASNPTVKDGPVYAYLTNAEALQLAQNLVGAVVQVV